MINEKYFNRLLGSLIVVALALPLTPSMVAAQDNGPGYTQVRTWSQRIRLQPCCHGWQQQHLVRHNARTCVHSSRFSPVIPWSCEARKDKGSPLDWQSQILEPDLARHIVPSAQNFKNQ